MVLQLQVLQKQTINAPITEFYADTVQGEGATIGRLSSFVRFTGCHRSCSWCDSKHTWDPAQLVTEKVDIVKIVTKLQEGKARNIILTGGEPLLHQSKKYFRNLVHSLLDRSFTIEIETEGSFAPEQYLKSATIRFNCSPKLKHAGMGDLRNDYIKLQPNGLSSLAALMASPSACTFKFVIQQESDVEEAIGIISDAIPWLSAPERHIYLMPEGTTRDSQLALMPQVMDWALKYGCHFSPRLHVLRWDDARGV